MASKTTLQLQHGDAVSLHGGRVVRIVADVRPTGAVNYRNAPLYVVEYEEGDTPEWSGSNGAHDAGVWELAEQCSWGAGADPAAGCDAWAKAKGLCDHHRECLAWLNGVVATVTGR